ncbi:MAG: glucose-6-phosphate isomerase, partial [Bacteroidales bacterium]|nr:glucose-6-phosphate isomerase [Bacteroidales bacterium]
MKLDISRVFDFIPAEEIDGLAKETAAAMDTLYSGSGAGNDFLGWLDLPKEITSPQLDEIEEAATALKGKTELLVVAGIGGSYLGARAVNDALAHNFAHLNKEQDAPHMLFAGHNIGEDYMHELLELLDTYSYSIVVISKSGTTTEPAMAFRILRDHLEDKVGKDEAARRIIAVTDR